jgi:hypothetical protein
MESSSGQGSSKDHENSPKTRLKNLESDLEASLLCGKPILFKLTSTVNSLTPPLAICQSLLHYPLLLLPCSHTFCGACAFKWLPENPTCPSCRSVVKETRDARVLTSILEVFRKGFEGTGGDKDGERQGDRDEKDKIFTPGMTVSHDKLPVDGELEWRKEWPCVM